MNTRVPSGIRGSVENHSNARELLKALDEQFESSDKTSASTPIMKFSSVRLTSVRGEREHMNMIRDITSQLKILEVDIFETLIVHNIPNTLPMEYSPFKISYNTYNIRINGQ